MIGRVRAMAAGAAEHHRAVDRGLHKRLPVMTTVAEIAHFRREALRISVDDLVRHVRRVNRRMAGGAPHRDSGMDALARRERLVADGTVRFLCMAGRRGQDRQNGKDDQDQEAAYYGHGLTFFVRSGSCGGHHDRPPKCRGYYNVRHFHCNRNMLA